MAQDDIEKADGEEDNKKKKTKKGKGKKNSKVAPETPKMGKHWRILQQRMTSARNIEDRLAGRKSQVFDSQELKGTKNNFLCSCGGGAARRGSVLAKISENHMEMEPLVCIDSCLVIEACRVCIGVTFFFLTVATAFSCWELARHKWWWLSDPSVYANAPLHYSVMFHLLIMIVVTPVILRGLGDYEYTLVAWHLRSQVVSLLLSLLQVVLFGLSVALDKHWSEATITTASCLLCNAVCLTWGISCSIVCLDYLKMLRVFVDMSDE